MLSFYLSILMLFTAGDTRIEERRKQSVFQAKFLYQNFTNLLQATFHLKMKTRKMLTHVGQGHFLSSNNGTEMKRNVSCSWSLVGSRQLFLSSEYLKVVTHDNLEEIYCILYSERNNRRGSEQHFSALL